MRDPHVVEWARGYRHARCWWEGCDDLVPLQQDQRFRGLYCARHLAELRVSAERGVE